MIDLFHYLGVAILINLIVMLFKKSDIKKINKIIDMHNNGNNLINGALTSEVDIQSVNIATQTINENRFKIIVGFLIVGWEASGIIISDQRPFFAILLCMMFMYVPLLKRVPENKRKTAQNIDIAIRIVLVSIILYNHFLR